MAVLNATNTSGLPLNKGVYPVRVMQVQPAEERDTPSQWDKGLPRERVTLRTAQKNQDGTPLEVYDYLTLYPKAGKRTKVYSIFSACLFAGGVIPEGASLDTDELVGKTALIVVDAKPDGQGMMIASYMPREATATQTATAVKAAAPTPPPAPEVTADDIDAI